MASPDVEIDSLRKVYPHKDKSRPPVVALDGVSLAIPPGEIFALLGPNGAGKTTLIGCVAGLVTPTSGSARVIGHDVIKDYQITRRAVGLVPQEINFDPFFTVEQSLRFQAGYFGVKLTEARIVEILAALGLMDKRKANNRTLSGGMKRRLLIGKALVHAPKVLFLDEPTAGVDVELRRDLWTYVRELRARGTTVILTTHYLEEAEELADRIGLIDQGKLLLVEPKAQLLGRFGERILRVTLAQPAPAVLPEALLALGARVMDGTGVLELRQPAGEELGSALAAVGEAGLHVRDVETRRTSLEEIYVRVLHEKEAR